MKYKPGQWLFLNCPDVSYHQWHPFTITSCPNDPYISVHVRQVGDFTRALADALGAGQSQSKLYDELDGGYYSYELGVKKPDPAYFDHIVRDLRVQRDRVLFVDDTWPNVVGARAAGIRAVHKPYAAGVAGLERVLRWHRVL